MYTVEYLILLGKNKLDCNNKGSLEKLLQVNSNISIKSNKIKFQDCIADIFIIKGEKEDSKEIYFNIKLVYNDDEVDRFSNLLQIIRRSLGIISQQLYILWDDLSLFYSNQAYPLIYTVENLMRKLISHFMLIKIGHNWTKDRVPKDVINSINDNNKDVNFLNNVDFIQLKNFLFSENFPHHKETVIIKLRKIKDINEINLDEIKSLLPESNWNKYFNPIIGVEDKYLIKRWDRLYDLRCKIAHNKSFSKTDYEETFKLVEELKKCLNKAINNLNSIIIPQNEKEGILENVAINLEGSNLDFILKLEKVENLIMLLCKEHKVYNPELSFNEQLDTLFEFSKLGSIDLFLLSKIYGVKTMILNQKSELSKAVVIFYNLRLDQIINEIKDELEIPF